MHIHMIKSEIFIYQSYSLRNFENDSYTQKYVILSYQKQLTLFK